jgi:hypothetical protein
MYTSWSLGDIVRKQGTALFEMILQRRNQEEKKKQ